MCQKFTFFERTLSILTQTTFFRAALLASQALPMVHRGDRYQQIEWVLLEAHSLLLDILLVEQKDNTALIAQRCEWLSALIGRATIPQNAELLLMQMKVTDNSWFSNTFII